MGLNLWLLLTCYFLQVFGAVIVSASPGLHNAAARELRAAGDDALAASLCEGGIQSFIETWYSQPMWKRYG